MGVFVSLNLVGVLYAVSCYCGPCYNETTTVLIESFSLLPFNPYFSLSCEIREITVVNIRD